ncbi:hypothetical protein NGC20_13495 [Enterococcus hirae]|uniref:EF0163 family protein n=1 Tax=Enterococcus hirae TaxID=1354 RepID=UPI0019EB49AC|nr:EF0163 family protein [Enterococcus hirae]EMF0574961.1 hypothetical protein [Enterococcus hirae]MEB7441000.1 hypothetical protein [Enterococcus hirae]
MKKVILLSLLAVLFLSGCHKKEETKVTDTNTSQSTMLSEDPTTETTKEPENPRPMLLAFGNKFLNFNSLKERNQSVKEYMTEKCQEENGINVDLDAKFRSVGKIVKVFQDTDSEKQYALLGEEDSRGVKNEVLFVVQLIEEDGQYKIDNFRYEQLHVH